jgi:hypothetical protein
MAGLGAIFALKQLDEDDVRMALRSTIDGVLSLVATPRVELWGLKAVRCENHLRATATNGLCFGCSKDCASQALTAMVCADPDVRDLATTSPSMASQTGDDFASFIPNACAQELAVEVACRFRVELVDAVSEELLQLLALSLVKQYDSVGSHGA